MRTIIISDTHLSNRFEEWKFDLLVRALKEADKVVLAGDFWDYLYTSFDSFLKSRWQELFPLLKERHAIYINGNHDPESLRDSRVSLFCDQMMESFCFTSGERAFYVVHGHQILGNLTVRYPQLGKIGFVKMLMKFCGWLTDSLPSKVMGRAYLTRQFLNGNERMKVWQKENLDGKTFLICGHTHRQDLDSNFANAGMIKNNLAQYLVVEDGVVTYGLRF
jgi:predicted phosphodiesterase